MAYTNGGGNRSILDALKVLKLKPKIFIAHDLDKDNRDLLIQRKLDFVLNHDLTLDLKCLYYILSHFGLSTQTRFYAIKC